MRQAWLWVILAMLTMSLASTGQAAEKAAGSGGRPPNFILLLVDNFGAGDLASYNPQSLHRTPHLDRMATEGMRLMSFYVASGVCTPSRASIMTGCYPRRVNLHVPEPERTASVLQPVAKKGLHPDEVTMAEVLKARGYATACIGKWHLGDQPAFLPTRQGFDEYLGVPYSEDMVENLRPGWPPLPLMRGEKVIEAPVDPNTLTQRYTQEAIRFIEKNKDQPFFLYLPHAVPGSSKESFASPAFRGKSRNGLYGDAVEELDWSTGEIFAALKRLKLDDKTMVVFTSDNGPVRRNPQQGSSAPFKGFGYDTSEGAMRMPCLVRWPGKVPAGVVSDELLLSMDLLPTFAHLAGAAAPGDRIIDGRDISPVLMGNAGAKSPHEAFYFYRMKQLEAVRSGPWKLYLPVPRGRGPVKKEAPPSKLELYDVVADVGEEREVSAAHPEVVKRLLKLAEKARADLGDGDREGANQRPAGRVEEPTARLLER